MTCRHGKPSFTCVSCGYEILLLAQRAKVLTWLPKDINKLIYSMIPKPRALRFQLDPRSGLLRHQHECNNRCYTCPSDQSDMLDLHIAFYGTEEAARGFRYGLVFRFNAEGEVWYHDGIDQDEYSDWSDINDMTDRPRIACTEPNWMFTSDKPEEFLSGLSCACEMRILEYSRLVDHVEMFEIWPPDATGFTCPNCSIEMDFDGEPCGCGNGYALAINYFVDVKAIRSRYPCEVICRVSELTVKPKARPVAVIVDPICTAVLKSGKRCHYKAKLGGLCGTHRNL